MSSGCLSASIKHPNSCFLRSLQLSLLLLLLNKTCEKRSQDASKKQHQLFSDIWEVDFSPILKSACSVSWEKQKHKQNPNVLSVESRQTGKEERHRKFRNTILTDHFLGVWLGREVEVAISAAFRATQVTWVKGGGGSDDPQNTCLISAGSCYLLSVDHCQAEMKTLGQQIFQEIRTYAKSPGFQMVATNSAF